MTGVAGWRALGIVFLPGAMVGLILAGVDPVRAVVVQGALMFVILASVAVSTTTLALLSVRMLFTADHRLRPLLRDTGAPAPGAGALWRSLLTGRRPRGV